MGEGEETAYQFIVEGKEPGTSSRHYTGIATANYPNGDKYEGSWADGIREGKGTYTYSSGSVYEGDWKENQKHGIGKMTFKEPSKNPEAEAALVEVGSYYGYWENNKKHGEGVFSYGNGDIYSGWWANGVKHGKGTYIIKATGQKIQGEWNNARLVQGTWELKDGSNYKGSFDNDKPQGGGVWTFANGNQVKGEYKQTKKVSLEGDDDTTEPEIKLSWRTTSSVYEARS